MKTYTRNRQFDFCSCTWTDRVADFIHQFDLIGRVKHEHLQKHLNN